jgi:hypothetical protein
MATSSYGRPTLHEIAAMPYPYSERAMREHCDPNWGKPKPEGVLRSYTVEVSYHFSGRDIWGTTVKAHNEEEAIELAEAAFDKADLDLPWEAEVDAADFKVTGTASADTRPEGGGATQIVAPFTSGAVSEGETPK